MPQRTAIAMVVLLALIPGNGHAATPARMAFQPSSDWQVEPYDERCSLVRSFNRGDDSLLLQIHSYGSYGDYSLRLVGDGVPGPNNPHAKVRYRFPADTTERDKVLGYFANTMDRRPTVTFSASIRPYEAPLDLKKLSDEEWVERSGRKHAPAPEFERAARSLLVEFGQGRRIELELGSMEAPLENLRGCIDGLVRTWGLNPEAQRHLSRGPIPEPSAIRAVVRRYPPAMLSAGRNGFVPVRIMVDSEGRNTQCVTQLANVQEAFRAAVCESFAQRFRPASDDAGRPIASSYHTTVVYAIDL